MLYGEGSHGHVMEVHQKLRDKFLTPWHSVPADAEIIFVSTQSSFLPLTQITRRSFNELMIWHQTLGIARMAFMGTSRSRRRSTSCVVSRD